MSKYGILKHDIFLPGPVLREMGASAADDNGILWTPRDQMISKDGRSVTLSPDPESLRRVFARNKQASFGKTLPAVSGPANAYNRMLAHPGLRALLTRLERRDLVPRAPNSYTALKPTANKNAPKPRITALSTMQRSIDLLHIKPEGLEAMIRPVVRAGIKLLSAPSPV